MVITLSESSITTIILFIIGYFIAGVIVLVNMHLKIKILKINHDSVLETLERLINVLNGVEVELRAFQIQLTEYNQDLKSHKESYDNFREKVEKTLGG